MSDHPKPANPLEPLILIIDDDNSIRSLLALAMQEEGYRVEEASNGEDGAAKFLQIHPDLVLLDAMMPKMDGFTCCQYLRSFPEGEFTPILMITFLDDLDSIEQAFLAGATDYITKPIHWEVLSRRVKRLLLSNAALERASSLSKQAEKQEAWYSLTRSLTRSLCESGAILQTIDRALLDVKNLLAVDSVLFFHVRGGLLLESRSPSFPPVRERDPDTLTLYPIYRFDYLQGHTVIIEDLFTTNLPGAIIDSFRSIDARSILLCPLMINARFQGVLRAHSSSLRVWNDTERENLASIAYLLALGLAGSDFLNAPGTSGAVTP